MQNPESSTVPRAFVATATSLAAVFLLVACGPTYEASDTPDTVERAQQRTAESIDVQIVNDVSPAGEAEIYAVPENGDRNYIALVAGGETTTVELTPAPDIGERYRLVAVVGGEEIESDTFVPAEATRVRWEMDANRVTSASEPEAEEDDSVGSPPRR